MSKNLKTEFSFGQDVLTIEDVWGIAHGSISINLCDKPKFLARIENGPKTVRKLLAENHIIYGVNTGFGNNCTVVVSEDQVEQLSSHLVAHHYCGMGSTFDEIQTRAILVARLTSLAFGYSGVRVKLLNLLAILLKEDILPCIPQTGSVGASGDLTPLSYVAAVLCGDRHVNYKGQMHLTEKIFKMLAIEPLKLEPKEGLALMNGTAVMTGLAAIAHKRAQYLAQLCSRISSLAVVALKGNRSHYDSILFSVKPHIGQQRVAAQIRADLCIPDAHADYGTVERIQDRYSIRCAPHIIGVLEDSLPFFRQLIEKELNSANDNPIIDSESGRVFYGAMFYGGHIGFAMDGMKILVANLADLLDRQLALLVDPHYNNGLPPNLSGEHTLWSHGLKAVQISCSAWTAEALKGTLPASVFSRSTECHNQDKVSMATIAARDCFLVLELTEQVAAALLIAVNQGILLRIKNQPNFMKENPISNEAAEFISSIQNHIPLIEGGIPVEPILRELVMNIQKQNFTVCFEEKPNIIAKNGVHLGATEPNGN